MIRYAAFLRGINLGRRRVTGEQLRAPFQSLDFTGVHTFLASGNVVFDAGGDEGAAALGPRIETRLEESLGYPVAVFLRSAAELEAIVAREPFSPTELQRSAGKLQVILLPTPPGPDRAADVLALATDEDRLALHGRELYWLPAGNMSASALDLGAIGRLVGPTTIRTANTVARLHAKFFSRP